MNTEDVTRDNMIFDTERLFSEETEYEEEELSALPDNMQAITVASEPFPLKELDESRFFAVVGKPTTKQPTGGYPAIVLVHGGAGQVYPDWIKYWTNKGYVTIALDIFGNKLDENLNKVGYFEGGPGEGQSGGMNDDPDDKENSWVYHNVCNIIRCNNILRSMPEVNPEKIGITGISWGGYLTCIVSGVDKRFAAFAPIYGCGYIFEDSNKWQGTYGGKEGSNGRKEWISAYDPSSYLPYSTKPTLFVSGIDDNCFSVVTRVKSYNLVKGKTFYSQRSNFNHGYYWDQTYEVYAFMQRVLNGEDTLMTYKSAGVRDGKAYIEFDDYDKIQGLRLVYTTDSDADSHNWRFETENIDVTEGVIEVELPDGVTAFDFEFFDMRVDVNFVMSTEIFLLSGTGESV